MTVQKIDMIACATQAYRTVWDERVYLLRLATIPFLIKFALLAIAVGFGLEGNILRFALVLLPAMFAEGWMLSHFVRLIYLNQRWPFVPTGDMERDGPALYSRARGVMAGMVGYVLIAFLTSGFFHVIFSFYPDLEGPDVKPDPLGLFVVFAGFGLMIGLFRYVWAYIPLAVNIRLGFFFKQVRDVQMTWPMIGLWLVCSVPVALFSFMFAQFLFSAMTIGEGSTDLSLPMFLVLAVRAAADTLAVFLATGGIAYALQGQYNTDKNKEGRA